MNEYVAILRRLYIGVTAEIENKKRCFKSLERIKHDVFFQKSAQRKYKSFMSHILKKRKKANRLSKAATHVAIAKIYQAKMIEDEMHKSKGMKCTKFDKFIFSHYLTKYGSKKLARRQTKRLVASIMHYGHKHPRFRLFGKLAGIRTRPVEGEQIDFNYDSMFCSDYFIPLLSSLMNPKEVEKNFSTGHPLHVLKFTFFIGLNNHSATHTPKNSLAYQDVKSKLEALAHPLGESDPEAVSPHRKSLDIKSRPSVFVARGPSKGKQKTSPESPTPVSAPSVTSVVEASKAGKGEPGVSTHHARGLRSALKKRLALTTLSQRSALDLDAALLAASEVWRFERMWHRIYNHVVCAKAARHWMTKIKSREVIPGKSIRTLCATRTHKRKLDRDGLYGVTTVTKAALACEDLTGINFRELVAEYDFHKQSIHKVSNLEHLEEPASASTSTSDVVQERLFHPSPRSPRVVLEAARVRDAAINNKLGAVADNTPVVAVEPS